MVRISILMWCVKGMMTTKIGMKYMTFIVRNLAIHAIHGPWNSFLLLGCNAKYVFKSCLYCIHIYLVTIRMADFNRSGESVLVISNELWILNAKLNQNLD